MILMKKGLLPLLLSVVIFTSASSQDVKLWGIPITPELLVEQGKLDVSDPEGEFKPLGEWEQSWKIWLPGRGKPNQKSGYLKIHRKPDANGTALMYDVCQVISENDSWLHSARASITAVNDSWGTPVTWNKSTRFHTSPASGSIHLKELDSFIEGSADSDSQHSSTHFITSYTLFDAVQRMSIENVTSLDFTLLDELDKVKENHSIRFVENTSVNFAGKDRNVKVFAETGEGLLPWKYYVDEKGRLLLAISGMRAYILDAGIESEYSEMFEHPASTAQEGSEEPEKRNKEDLTQGPNILFLSTDQQTWNTLSAYGNSFVRTPSLDRLANEGVSFRNSYTTNPVCSPARASWLTGLTPAENGVISNGLDIVENISTVGNMLSDQGYETVFAGKLHVGIPKSYGEEIPGFSKVLCQGIGGKGTLGDQVVSSVCEGYLQNRDKSKPFFMSVNFLQPHDICNWISRFSKDPEKTPFFGLKIDDLPPLPDNFNAVIDEPEQMKVARKEEWGEMEWRYYLWSYNRMIEEMDAEIGRVLRALEESGELENTVIIFNSDHGEGNAHHQSVLKNFTYDESSRVPFIITYPKELQQGVMDEKHLISGLDVVSTICDFAGAETPENTKGLSVRNIAAGIETPWRDFVVTEVNHDQGRMIRTDQYKLIAFRDDPHLLFFDMKNDPGETINLALEEDYQDLIETHIKLLEEWEANLVYAPNSPGLFKVNSARAFSQEDTVNRAYTMILSKHNYGLANTLWDDGSPMVYDPGLVDSLGAAFSIDYTDPGEGGMDAYASGHIGGFKTGGRYYPGNPAACGMPVKIEDLGFDFRIRWQTSQKDAGDADDKWWATINVIFDGGAELAEPVSEDRDFDIVIQFERFEQDALEDKPHQNNTVYWWFARNPDTSIKPFVLHIGGVDYEWAVRYKFFDYPAGDPNEHKNNKVHIKYIPVDNNNVAPFLDHPLLLFIENSSDYLQYVDLPEAELELARQKVSDPGLWIKTLSAGYEVYTGQSTLRNNYFLTLTDSVAPASPSSLSAAEQEEEEVALNWDDHSDDAFEAYAVYRSDNGTAFNLIASGVRVSNYTDSTVKAGVSYDYYVITLDRSFNESSPSSLASVTIESVNINMQTDNPAIILYPNPGNDKLFITGDPAELRSIELYSLCGSKQNFTFKNETNRIELDISDLSSGLYLIRTSTTTSKVFKK